MSVQSLLTGTDRPYIFPEGVYNINKGYTVFTQVEILDSNSEYYTIKNNVTYGLSVYDHIVLDASSVGEGQLLYQ